MAALHPDSRLPTPDSRLPTPDSRLPTPDSRLPTPNSRLPIPDSRFPNSLKLKTKVHYPIDKCYNCKVVFCDIGID
ncbi:MAG: hypothetical protein F6K26_32995 [Moorea sp. SIO2I5]|nr:hypothetical protein [Moorena sp. SIO2I5]